jgi:hypothetical protein
MSGIAQKPAADRSATATVPKTRSLLITNKKALQDPVVRKEVTRLYNLIHQVDRTTSLTSSGAASHKKLKYASTRVIKSGGSRQHRSDEDDQSLSREFPPRKLRVIKCPTVERSGNPFDREDLSSMGSALGHSKVKTSPPASSPALSNHVMSCLGIDSGPADSGRKRTLASQEDEEDSGIKAPSEQPQPGGVSPSAFCWLFSLGSPTQEQEAEDRVEPRSQQDPADAKSPSGTEQVTEIEHSVTTKRQPATRASSWLWNVFEDSVSVALSQETGPDPLVGSANQDAQHEAGGNKDRRECEMDSREARDDEPEYSKEGSKDSLHESSAPNREAFHQHEGSCQRNQEPSTKKGKGRSREVKQESIKLHSNEAKSNWFWFWKSKQSTSKDLASSCSERESRENDVQNSSSQETNHVSLHDASESVRSENHKGRQGCESLEQREGPLVSEKVFGFAEKAHSSSDADAVESTIARSDPKHRDHHHVVTIAEKPELKSRRSSTNSASIKRTPSLISVKSMRTLVSTTSACGSNNSRASCNADLNSDAQKIRTQKSTCQGEPIEPATASPRPSAESTKPVEEDGTHQSANESYLLGYLLAQLAFQQEAACDDNVQSGGTKDDRALDLKDGMTLSEIMRYLQDHHAPRMSKGYLAYILTEFARHACTVDRAALQKGYAERLCKRPAALRPEADNDVTVSAPPNLLSTTTTTSAVKDASDPSIDRCEEEVREVSDLQAASSSIESSPTQESEEGTASESRASDDASAVELVVRVKSNAHPANSSTKGWSCFRRGYSCCGPVPHTSSETGEAFDVIADAVETTIEALREDAEGSSTGSSEAHSQFDPYENDVGAWFSFLDGKEESFYSSVDEGDDDHEIEDASLESNEVMEGTRKVPLAQCYAI